MTRLRTPVVVFATAFAVLALPGLPSASAHTHPAPPDLTAPGVVYIQSGYHLHITVVKHTPTMKLLQVRGEYNALLTTGSGFVVNPSAVIVTSAAVTSPDVQKAKNFAINSIFKKTYGAGNPTLVPSDLYAQRSFDSRVGVGADYSDLARLKACYEGQANSAGLCVVSATPFITVHPYVTNQAKFGNLDATLLATRSGVAVLKVSAGTMPTVKLVDVSPAAYHLWVFGFHGVPVVQSPLVPYKAHLDKPGGTSFKAPTGDNAPFAKVTSTVLSDGLQGGPVAVELGEVIGMISATPAPAGTPGAGGPSLIGTKVIRAALAAANETAAPGLADGGYNTAMHRFQNKGYAAAIPGFSAALAAYPGHYLAAKYLKQAETLAGVTGSSSPPPPSQSTGPSAGGTGAKGTRWGVWVLVAVAVLLAAGAAAWFFLRQRRRPARASTPGPGSTPPHPAVAPASASRAPGAAPGGNSKPPLVTQSVSRPDRAPGRETRGPVARAEAGAVHPRAGLGARAAVADGARFCTSCGGRLAAHHAFCGWCGEPVC